MVTQNTHASDETTAFETGSTKRSWSTSTSSDIETSNRNSHHDDSHITSDASATLKNISSDALSKTEISGLQAVSLSQPQRDTSGLESVLPSDSQPSTSELQDVLSSESQLSTSKLQDVLSSEAQLSTSGLQSVLSSESQLITSGLQNILFSDSQLSTSGLQSVLTSESQLSTSGLQSVLSSESHLITSGLQSVLSSESHLITSGLQSVLSSESHPITSGLQSVLSSESHLITSGLQSVLSSESHPITSGSQSVLLSDSQLSTSGLQGVLSSESQLITSGLQSVLPSDPQLSTSGLHSAITSELESSTAVMAYTVAHDFVSTSEMTSPLVTVEDSSHGETTEHGGIFEESSSDAFNPKSSGSEKLTTATFNASSNETWSDAKHNVTSGSPSHTFSTDTVITADGETTTMTILISTSSHAEVMETSDYVEAKSTVGELTTVYSNVSAVENRPSHDRTDSSFQHLDVNGTQLVTTQSLLSSHKEEIHVTSERPHTIGRTIEDTARTLSPTTDTPSAPQITSEATTRTLHTNGTTTVPVIRTKFFSQAGDQFSTVSEVASESPLAELDSSSSNGQYLGMVVGASVAGVVLILILIVILAIIFRRNRQSSYIMDNDDPKDYRLLMKRRNDKTGLTSPSVANPISPFSDVFPQDVTTNNGPPASKYKMTNFDRNWGDDGLDGVEIVHHDDDSRQQSSPKEIPMDEDDVFTPSGYSDCSYSVNTFRPPEKKTEKKTEQKTEQKTDQKDTNLANSEAETKFNANESVGNDEKAIEE